MSAERDVCPGRVSAQVGVSARGGEVSAQGCGQTDTCENITFPQLLSQTVINEKIPILYLEYQLRPHNLSNIFSDY